MPSREERQLSVISPAQLSARVSSSIVTKCARVMWKYSTTPARNPRNFRNMPAPDTVNSGSHISTSLESMCLRKGWTRTAEIRVISEALTRPLGFASVRRVSETEECNRMKSFPRGLKRLDEQSQPLLCHV